MRHNDAFLRLVDEARDSIQEFSVDEVFKMQQSQIDFTLIDVREDREWNESRIVTALHMGRGILERDIETSIPDRGKNLVLYCGGGYRSALSAANLKKMGYTNVSSMNGGFKGWCQAMHPIEEGNTND